jgi:hypothetical protein
MNTDYPNPKKLLAFATFLCLALSGCVSEPDGVINACVVPQVVRTSPEANEANVSLSKTSMPARSAKAGAIKVITATFNTPMDPASINPSTFILRQGTDTLAGSVSYTDTTAVFTAPNDLLPGATYTVTITTGVSALGTHMAADYTWSFSTDSIPPAPVLIAPAAGATNQATSPMLSWNASAGAETYRLQVSTNPLFLTTVFDDSTITGTSRRITGLTIGTTYYWRVNAKNSAGTSTWSTRDFTTIATAPAAPTLASPANASTGHPQNPTLRWNASVGADTYRVQLSTSPVFATTLVDDSTVTGLSRQLSGLTLGTTYYWRVNAKNTGGTSVYSATWSFTVSTTQPSVNLASSAKFGGMGGSAGITNQGLLTQINGSLSTTAVSTMVTGFHDGTAPPSNSFTETPLNAGAVRDTIHTATAPPGSVPGAAATQALADANAAYLYLAGLPPGSDPGAGELGGLTLAPGTYTAASGSFAITLVDLTLDAQGDPNAQFVFQVPSSLTVGSAGPAGARSVILIGGAQAKNVFWQVGAAATINGAGGGTMVGTIIASSGVTLSTAGNVVLTRLEGRALSLISSVTMVNTVINVPLP